MMQSVPQPELKNMLAEASHALAHLDTDRLEEMTLSCTALSSRHGSDSIRHPGFS